MTTPSRVYVYEDDVENLEKYRAGGFYPLHLNHEFRRGRYRIIHKLGYGAFSTVWLALDKVKARYVAVKIAVATTTKMCQEKDMLKYLNEKMCPERHSDEVEEYVNDDKNNTRSIPACIMPTVLDHFFVESPNGQHECLVSKPFRCSLSDAKEGGSTNLFQLDTARFIAAQLILGVQNLHSRGIVHADLHLGNILLQEAKLDSLSPEEIYQKYGAPDLTPIERVDGAPVGPEAPQNAVMPMWMGIACDELAAKDALIQLCDFGEAFQPTYEIRSKSHVPRLLRPPEANFLQPSDTNFGDPSLSTSLSFPADIWTLACTLFELFSDGPLFEGWRPSENTVLADNISALGMMPAEWMAQWKAKDLYITSSGEWREDRKQIRPLAVRADEMGRVDISAEERADLLDMLSQMLKWRPEERITAEELTRVKWMQDWGWPTFDKLFHT